MNDNTEEKQRRMLANSLRDLGFHRVLKENDIAKLKPGINLIKTDIKINEGLKDNEVKYELMIFKDRYERGLELMSYRATLENKATHSFDIHRNSKVDAFQAFNMLQGRAVLVMDYSTSNRRFEQTWHQLDKDQKQSNGDAVVNKLAVDPKMYNLMNIARDYNLLIADPFTFTHSLTDGNLARGYLRDKEDTKVYIAADPAKQGLLFYDTNLKPIQVLRIETPDEKRDKNQKRGPSI